MNTEIWKDVPGLEGRYQVSNHGNVRGLDREVPNTRWGSGRTRQVKGRAVKTSVAKSTGYPVIGLRKDGKHIKLEVHSIVALAFIGPRPSDCFVHHRDENKTNNRVENLTYIPYKLHTSLHNKGEKNFHAKLTLEDVATIRELIDEGVLTQTEIAEKFHVCQVHISAIKLGKVWAENT